MNKKKITAAILASVSLLSACTAVVEMPQTAVTTEEETFDVSSIRAQDDYYGYINGEYLYELEVNPVSGSAGSFEQCQDIIMERLIGILEDVIAGDRSTYEDGSSRQIIYDAYYQMMDSDVTMESASVVRILNMIDVINDAGDINELLDAYRLVTNDFGVLPYYSADIDVNLYNSDEYVPVLMITGLGDLEQIQWGGTVAIGLKDDIAQTLRIAGVEAEEADDRANNVVRMQIDLASHTDFELLERIQEDMYGTEYTLMTIDEFDAAFTNGGIDYFCRMSGINPENIANIGVYDLTQMTFLDSYLTDENLQVLKDIAIFKMINEYGGMIPFEEDTSIDPSIDDVAMTFMRLFSEQVNELYTEYYYDEAIVNDVIGMTEAIIDEYIVQVNDSYMSDEGKAAIIDKLQNMRLYIGAKPIPEVNPNNANLIGEDAVDTMIIANANFVQSLISKLGSPVNPDEEGWAMSSYTVNACYKPRTNSINIPLGIMLPPFYDPDAEEGTNYGGIGVVIGHEISHAFDDSGMNYDANGEFNPMWIPDNDRAVFDERNQVLVEYFNTFTVNDVYHVNGEKTLGENLADIGGMQCVLNILGDRDQQQLAFESYARVWASVTPVDDAIYYLEVDVHSPDRIRVNAVVALFDEFYEIYEVGENDGMFVASERRVRRW